MVPPLPPILHDPLFLFLVGTLGLAVRDVVKSMLRKHAAALRADKDPSNDRLADLEDSTADAIDRFKLPGAK